MEVYMYNNYGYPYGYLNYQQPQQQHQIQQPLPPKSNKIWVTSLEDALARAVEPNSEYIYLHQDQPLLIEVKTDIQGKKVTRVLELKDYVQHSVPQNVVANDFPTREEFDGIKAEIQALKQKIETTQVE